MRGVLAVVLPILLMAAGGSAAFAQARGWRLSARADVFLAEIDAAHVGGGVTTDIGSYIRLETILAGGAARIGHENLVSVRGEVVGRFLLDPFREARWGPYFGAGLVGRFDRGESGRGLVTILFGTDLPASGRLVPALEVGYGGGLRLAAVIRAARPSRR